MAFWGAGGGRAGRVLIGFFRITVYTRPLTAAGRLTPFPRQSLVGDWDPPRLQRSSRRAPDTDVKA